MNKCLKIAAILLLGSAVWAENPLNELHVYKSPWCGCCKEWMEIAAEHDFAVSHEHLESLDAKKEELGVPKQLASCHTGLIGGFFIEGHVPMADIQRLLLEKPEGIVGLAVPGMPMNSPGMAAPGVAYSGFKVVAVHEDGSFSEWASY